ncbi:hypothetical protein Aph02nite_32710 [Actinoplanes philippinensis]|uniref:Methyl-accepting chemotaxis protein n=2 Tax=Actinoplanes philippinensis TaxID=35752 RepID=A0A1I2E2J5_9ACTN|nr:hypothetical protein Aph02nite_32710 [Actinoplanes philippinensis]SFE86788.1 methyl-accepting chemotaxis protein [Actinoplanes philippinensis]
MATVDVTTATVRSADTGFCALSGRPDDEVIGEPLGVLWGVPSQAVQSVVGAGQDVAGPIEVVAWPDSERQRVLAVTAAAVDDGVVLLAAEDRTTESADQASPRQAVEDRAKVTALGRSQAVIEFDLSGTILEVNQNFLATMGYTREEVVGQHHRIFVPDQEARGPGYRDFWNRLSDGQYQGGVYLRVAKDGRPVWLRATYNPILGPDGRPVKIVKFAADITADRQRTAEFEGKIAAVSRSRAMIEFDMDGTILDANQNFLDTMGYTLDEIVGRHHRMFMPPGSADRQDYSDFWKRLGRGDFVPGEFKRMAKGDREVWLLASYNPVLGPDGRPSKVFKFAADITEEQHRTAEFRSKVAAISRSQAVIEFSLDGGMFTHSRTTIPLIDLPALLNRRRPADPEAGRVLLVTVGVGATVGLVVPELHAIEQSVEEESGVTGPAGRPRLVSVGTPRDNRLLPNLDLRGLAAEYLNRHPVASPER